MNGNWKKVTSARVDELLEVDELDGQAQTMIEPGMRPDTLIHDLAAARLWGDAITLAARTLPPREAVWWGCVCARKMASIADDEAEQSALRAAESWVYKPSDESREKAFELAKASDSCRAGGLCAFAATFNESKLPMVDGSDAELDKSVFSSMVAGAVMMAAGDGEADEMFKRFDQFLDSAEDIANGGDGRIVD